MSATGPGRTWDYDVLVIGAGLAGLVAAARAGAAGARVGVVALSSGNLGLWSGLIGARCAASGDAAEAARFFLDFSEKAGLPYSHPRRSRFNLISPAGWVRPCALAPATMAAGDLGRGVRQAGSPGLLLVGFTELQDYPVALVAAKAREVTGLAVEHRSLRLGAVAERGQASRVAGLFDDPQWFASFLDTVARVLSTEAAPVRAVGFPPVLGLTRFAANLQALRDRVARPVFELPALPPSVPGQRFWRFWRHHLEYRTRTAFHIGRRITETGLTTDSASAGPVARRKSPAGQRCLWVSDGLSRYRARSFVLATGGVAGGGLVVSPTAFFAQAGAGGGAGALPPAAAGGPREGLFDLAVHGQGRAWGTWGVRTDRDGRPYLRLSGPRAEPLSNVYVAGWLLGALTTRDPDGMLSVESGWRAGGLAAAAAGRGSP